MYSAHGGTLSGSGAQYAYSDIALATRMGSGENLKHMSWRPLRHSAGQRWKLCEQKQKNVEAVSCTSWAALEWIRAKTVSSTDTNQLMLCQMLVCYNDCASHLLPIAAQILHTYPSRLPSLSSLCRLLQPTIRVPGCVGKRYDSNCACRS